MTTLLTAAAWGAAVRVPNGGAPVNEPDVAEVDRVARLMHEAYAVWWVATAPDDGTNWIEREWDTLKARHQEGFRAVARAVIADLMPQPYTVTS